MKEIKCVENSSDCEDWGGFFKIYVSKEFKKLYGKKGIEKSPWCINCIFRLLEGGQAEWNPEWLIKIKRIE